MTRLTLVAIGCVVALPPPAHACGGMFCSTAPPDEPPAPIDQNAERVIFVAHADGSVTAAVQIQYVGTADEFAWVIPVSSVPTVEEWSTTVFEDLEAATALEVELPPAVACPNTGFGGGGCSSGCSEDLYAAMGDLDADGDDPVTVYSHDFTANYEYDVVGADDTNVLVDWLQTNGYNVSDNMRPVMDAYNGATTRFLAIKLRDGRLVSDIAPLAFTYTGGLPGIPLRLTAVAAQPLMGILVYVVAAVPHEPANYDVRLPPRDLLYDFNGNTNYYEWVARKADEADGKLFVAEYIGPLSTEVPGQPADAVVSRYYTRMSPHHMTEDPVFAPNPTLASVANTLDLSGRPSLFGCGTATPPSPCAFNYCGAGAECADSSGVASCICPAGQVAQGLRGPDGTGHVSCVPAVNAVGVTDQAAGVGSFFDPCNDFACGAGTCVVRGGFPTCQCADGAAATIDFQSRLSCETLPPGYSTFGPGAGEEAAGGLGQQAAASPRPTPNRPLGPWLWLSLGAAAMTYQRRRDRRPGS